MQTGYFATPGKSCPRAKVHLVVDGKPICGSQMGTDSIFQWCSQTVCREWVECKRCLKSLDAWLRQSKKGEK